MLLRGETVKVRYVCGVTGRDSEDKTRVCSDNERQ